MGSVKKWFRETERDRAILAALQRSELLFFFEERRRFDCRRGYYVGLDMPPLFQLDRCVWRKISPRVLRAFPQGEVAL